MTKAVFQVLAEKAMAFHGLFAVLTFQEREQNMEKRKKEQIVKKQN